MCKLENVESDRKKEKGGKKKRRNNDEIGARSFVDQNRSKSMTVRGRIFARGISSRLDKLPVVSHGKIVIPTDIIWSETSWKSSTRACSTEVVFYIHPTMVLFYVRAFISGHSYWRFDFRPSPRIDFLLSKCRARLGAR